MPAKVLLIGVDGATWKVIKPWVARGHLPGFGRLIERGVHGNLTSTPNHHSSSAWTSVITGVNPGKHGIFSFSNRDPLTGDIGFVTGAHRRVKALWDFAPDLQLGFVNVPMTFPVEPLDGVMIAGISSPAISSPGACYPADILSTTLEDQAGDYVITPPGNVLLRGNREKVTAPWLNAIKMRGLLARRLLQDRDFDLFMVVFTATDWVQHFFWQELFEDASHSSTGQAIPNEQSIILAIHQAVDREIRRLLDSVTDDTTVMAFSDHGFGPQWTGQLLLDHWLVKEGFLALHQDAGSRLRRWSLNQFSSSLRSTSAKLPEQVKAPLRTALKSVGLDVRVVGKAARRQALLSQIDWSQTRAYRSPVFANGVFLNDGQNGKVTAPQAHPAYNSERTELIDRLHAWRDERSGERFVERAWRREEIYQGDFVHQAPDVQIWWRDAEFDLNDAQKELLIKHTWAGSHRMEGIFLGCGGPFRPGERLDGACLYDITPTLLYLLGRPVPDHMDGQPLLQAFDEAYVADHPLKRVETAAGRLAGEDELSAAELEEIESRLRGLGYL